MTKACNIKVCCINCGREISRINFDRHSNSCNGSIPKKVTYPTDLKCRYCGKHCKNKNSFSNHERTCPSNPNRNYKNGMTGKKGSNQFINARLLGFPIPDGTMKGKPGTMQGKSHSNETKKKLSESMKLAVKNNPDSYSKNNVAGRVKLIEYNGIKLKGSWELKTAQWLDSLGVQWKHETNPQKYYWNDDWHLYFPDFFLPEYSMYIEVKGYKTERDDAKWSQFNNKLVVVDSKNVHNLHEYKQIDVFIIKFAYN